jgi:hypothetical protein
VDRTSTQAVASAPTRSGRIGLAVACAALAATPFFWRLILLRTRTFDPDEFQHLHAGWLVHQGLLPYRDFFEHHMPGIQYMLASLMGPLHVDTSIDDAIRFLVLARTVMWVFAGCSLLLTMLIGARLGGPPVGWLGGALLGTSVVFLGRTLEIRPDTPALACWLACTLALLRALDPGDAPGNRRLWFAVGGLCLGCGLVFNQKLLLAGPGLAAWTVWYFAHPNLGPLPKRIANIAVFGAASAFPLLLLAGFFWSHGAAMDLVRGAFINNLGWPREVSAATTLNWMLVRDPFLSAFSAAGLVQAAFLFVRRPWASSARAVLLFPTLSFLVGLAIIPAPYPQYMLLVLPAGAIFGATALWQVVTAFGQRSTRMPEPHAGPEWAAVALVFALVATLGLTVARPFFVHPAVYPAFGVAALVAAVVLARREQAEWAAVVVLLACSAYSFQQLRWMQGLSNAEALQQMRYVEAATTPADTVLDGFTGVAWFRKPASFYPFLHAGARARLKPTDVRDLVGVLDSCATRPALVMLDDNLRALSPAMGPAVLRYYDPSPFPPIWAVKPVWPGCPAQ